MQGLFITGTDTGCGKTEISLGLMNALQSRGVRVLAMKPVATGARLEAEGLRNLDALRLLEQGSRPAPYGLVNPYAFEPPIAPHLAAGEVGSEIDFILIEQACRRLASEADLLVVEGVGGWRVPLGPDRFVSDLAVALGFPVVLVVGLKLGCINHALLTMDSMRAKGAAIAGWVANQVEPDMLARDANLATLAALLHAPCIGVVPWLETPTPQSIGALLQPECIEHLDALPALTSSKKTGSRESPKDRTRKHRA